LVGLTIPTIFSYEQFKSHVNLPIPEGSRLAYTLDIVSVLKDARKYGEAEQLERLSEGPYDMCYFEQGAFELVE